MRTLSASPIDAVANPDGPTDLENRVVDGIESLRQRIVQRLRFTGWANGSLTPAGERKACWATTSRRNWQRR